MNGRNRPITDIRCIGLIAAKQSLTKHPLWLVRSRAKRRTGSSARCPYDGLLLTKEQMLDLNPDIANKIVTARKDVDDIEPVQKAFMLRFTGANGRWMGIAREERVDWVTVYINRQSRALDWFPVADTSHFFEGVEVGYRYVKGHKGKAKNPGMSASIAKLRTLQPAENHVLLLHCAKRSGFEDLVKWYSGERVLGVGGPPLSTEISGEGSYIALERHAVSPIHEVGTAVDLPSSEPTDVRDVDADGPSGASLLDNESRDPDILPMGDGSDADQENDADGRWLADPQRRKAVETHAVRMAIAHYTSLGFLVEEKGKPYDLLCTPTEACPDETSTVHVEVKGSLGSAMTVHLTRNEVAHARSDGTWRSDLYIVSGISLIQEAMGVWAAKGGAARYIEDWSPLDDDLTPIDYLYTVPIE